MLVVVLSDKNPYWVKRYIFYDSGEAYNDLCNRMLGNR